MTSFKDVYFIVYNIIQLNTYKLNQLDEYVDKLKTRTKVVHENVSQGCNFSKKYEDL